MSPILLADGFARADRAAWRALAEKALRGERLEEALVSHTLDGLEIAPLYARDDRPEGRLHIPASDAGGGGAGWEIRQRVALGDMSAARRAIGEELEGGVEGLVLQIASPGRFGIAVESPDDLARLLEGVRLETVSLGIDAGWRSHELARWMIDRLGSTAEAPKADVALGLDPLGTLARLGTLGDPLDDAITAAARLARDNADAAPKLRPFLVDTTAYHAAGATEAQELALLAATLVAYLRAMDTQDLAPADAFPRMGVRMATDTDLFSSMAKLRAARLLMARIAQACDASEAARVVPIHAETAERMLTRRDPWVNMLRLTVAVTAAALGGADAITALPFSWAIGAPDRFARRNARNIQLVLREESHLGRIADPASGSFYVDHLTDALARKAWALFQEIEAMGGMDAALTSGRVQSMLAESRKARAERVATLRDPLTGTSAFPALDEKPLEAPPHAAAPPLPEGGTRVEALCLQRLSAPFEALRDASDAHLAAHEQRPRAFLVPLGQLAGFADRARLARNLLAAGGIEAVAKDDGFAEPDAAARAFSQSGCRIACLAGPDALYETLGPSMVAALRQAGARAVYVAGRPSRAAIAAALAEAGAGIDRILDEGENVLAALREIHAQLGMGVGDGA